MRKSALLDAKNLEFFEIYGMSAKLSQCGHFADKGEEVNFSRFCADVFYGSPKLMIF